MKKYWPYIVVGIFLMTVLVQECNHSSDRKDYKDELQKKDSVINIQKYVNSELQRKMKLDSIEYEKEKQHIKELRARYPDNALLDSLFVAGQSID